MKKSIRVIMISAISISMMATTVAATENFADLDLQSMSLEDLVLLKDKVNEEIAAKGGNNVLGAGIYEVGKDIKAASFRLTCYEATDYAYVTLYKNSEDMDNEKSIIRKLFDYEEDQKSQDIVTLNLKEGEILKTTGPVIIENEEKSFWAPDSEDE